MEIPSKRRNGVLREELGPCDGEGAGQQHRLALKTLECEKVRGVLAFFDRRLGLAEQIEEDEDQ